MNTPSTRSTHPLLLIAAVAVVLFCGVGIAALMGWLPTSGSAAAPAYTSASGMSDSSQLAAANLAREPVYPPGYQPGPAPSPDNYAAPPVREPVRDSAPQRLAQAEPAAPAVCKSCGVIESVREVTTRAQGTGVGAGVGAVVGGLLGNQIGGGHGRQLATVAGAVGGGVVGNQVEGNMRATRSYTIQVRMDDGSHRTFHRSSPGWQSGERVHVVKGDLRKG
ncbi:glycine zipper 2TM domain-containing protein [Pseudoduganella sp. LjRoot289]|uniref:glycine zipper 2TM domain-containing protein n=1 Tax=Pseudoduganella sp. LjRoot289 TaxID=3342314 RepID=UPI003ECF7129